MSSLQDFQIDGINGGENLVPSLAGKLVLLVNVASRCGLTPQYDGLQALQRELVRERFTVLGIPCNQFGEQEPGSEDEILEFCSSTYQVDFPMTCKVDVNGPNRHPLYNWLTSSEGGFPGDIEWNFEKFLLDRDGKIRKRYPPATPPDDKGLLQDVADLLDD